MSGFEGFLGNEYTVKGLNSMILSGRVNHAYIFDAPEGYGKKTLARLFAKNLQCESPKVKPCGHCRSCKTIDTGENPDVVWVSTDEKILKTDIIRDEVVKKAYVKPYSSEYKIFIIEDSQKMGESAQNALLKTIEEPPPYGIFILLTTGYTGLLQTILSRCILVRLSSLPTEVIKRELMKRTGLEAKKAEVIAGCSGGSLGKALKLSDDEEFSELRHLAAEIPIRAEHCTTKNFYDFYDLLSVISDTEKNLPELLKLLYFFYRDLIVYKTCGKDFIIQKDFEDKIKELCEKVGLKRLFRGAESVLTAEEDIRLNINREMSIEHMLFGIKEK